MMLAQLNYLETDFGSFATNKYFADLFGLNPSQIQNIIRSLKIKKIIRVIIRNRNQRLIRVAKKWHFHTPEWTKNIERS